MRALRVSTTNRTRGRTPRIPFTRIKDAVLGPAYELSLVFVSPPEARRITRKTKHKDAASNVLSFPLSKTSGEIIICPKTALREASAFGMTTHTFVAYLFIHGLMHLKGYEHGGTMERAEQRCMTRFGFSWKNSSLASTSARTKSK